RIGPPIAISGALHARGSGGFGHGGAGKTPPSSRYGSRAPASHRPRRPAMRRRGSPRSIRRNRLRSSTDRYASPSPRPRFGTIGNDITHQASSFRYLERQGCYNDNEIPSQEPWTST